MLITVAFKLYLRICH